MMWSRWTRRWAVSVALGAVAVLLGTLPGASGAGLLDVIKSRGALQLCVADYPYIQKDPATGQWVGYDADLAKMFASQLKVKVEWVDVSWGNIVPALLANKCDAVWSAPFVTAERAKVVNFTNTVHDAGLLVVVHKGDTRFPSYAALNSPSVTFVELPDVSEKSARANFPKAKIKIIQSDNVNAPALEVVAGRADANVADALLAYDLVQKNAGVQIVKGPILDRSDEAYMVRKDSPDLLAAVNKFLADMGANGTLKQLATKYHVPPGFR